MARELKASASPSSVALFESRREGEGVISLKLSEFIPVLNTDGVGVGPDLVRVGPRYTDTIRLGLDFSRFPGPLFERKDTKLDTFVGQIFIEWSKIELKSWLESDMELEDPKLGRIEIKNEDLKKLAEIKQILWSFRYGDPKYQLKKILRGEGRAD
jgi:hypothetical protein